MTGQTFGWDKKLRKTDEFSSVFHFRCLSRGRLLDVSMGPNQQDLARLGLIVPKKFIPTAVARNRIKRLLREWFRTDQADLAGFDIIARLKSKPDRSTPSEERERVLQNDFLSGLIACQDCVNRKKSVYHSPTFISDTK